MRCWLNVAMVFVTACSAPASIDAGSTGGGAVAGGGASGGGSTMGGGATAGGSSSGGGMGGGSVGPTDGGTRGTIDYHIAFPSMVGGSYTLSPSQDDLLMSIFIAGVTLGHLVHEHRPAMTFDRNYLCGTLFGQWLQENLQPNYLDPSQEWIDTDPSQRTLLLSPGQGGPFQLNDYSKRLESGFGLVNFVALQGQLPFTVADQDSNAQTARVGPPSLENKYFGPMAAAYFHYNDLLRVEALAATSFYPQAANTTQCFAQVEAGRFPQLEMVLNAVYNAGGYSGAYAGYVSLCAHANDSSWATKLARIDDDTLDDAAYRAATGINDTGTFILYPRQVRNYLNQLYGLDTRVVPVRPNVLRFELSTLRGVFIAVFGKLGVANGTSWRAITSAEAGTAFDQARTAAGLDGRRELFISTLADRTAFFDLVEGALTRLTSTVGSLGATAQVNLALGERGSVDGGVSVTCPPTPQVYPAGRGAYASGTVVQGSDGAFYVCLPGVAAWCNSPSALAYEPGSGYAWMSAWSRVTCP